MVLSFPSKVLAIKFFFFDTFSCFIAFYSFEYIARRRGGTFVRPTLIDVLPDILKALPLQEIEELVLSVIIVFI